MSNKPELPVEVVEKIKQESREYAKKHGRKEIGYYAMNWKAGATAYATQLHQAQQENAELKRWKMEAAELLTKIHSYAHKHLEIKLGESTVEFVIERAKERDKFKLGNDRLKIALENVYRINGHQWSEYDRNVIKELIK